MRIPILLALMCAILPSVKYQTEPEQFKKVKRVHPPTVENWSRIAKIRSQTNQAPLVPGDATTGLEA
jgi:hypothetical protein